ncbi:MAG: phytoene desaturase family protein [Planctomyces sp.]
MQSISGSRDVVIVGSGHNGLVAAAYLAAAGKSVLVLERSPVAGGAAVSQRVFPDHDAWLSRYSYLVSLLPDQIVRELGLNFRTLRRRVSSYTPWRDGAGRQRGLLLFPDDLQRSRESMSELPGGAAEWQSYLEFGRLQSELATVVAPSFLQPLQTRQQFLRQLQTADQRRAWDSFVERPLGEVIERCFRTDVVRGLVMTDGKIGVLASPHDENLLQNRCFLYHVCGNGTGEWRVPEGGMRSLTGALLSRCRAAGAEVLTESPAVQIEPGPRWHRVTFQQDGRECGVDAEYVLLNAGPRTAARLLGQNYQSQPADEGSVIKINMLLRRLPRLLDQGVLARDAFAGTFHVDEGYEQMLQSWKAAVSGEIPNPAPGEIYCHTLTDASILSPQLQAEGYHTLTLFGLDMPWRLFEHDHDARREAVLQRYQAGMNPMCAEPFEDCLARSAGGELCLEMHTPQDLQSELDLDSGNIFHNQPSWFFAETGELSGQRGVETPWSRIYLAGSAALRGGAISGIPGYHAARCVLET